VCNCVAPLACLWRRVRFNQLALVLIAALVTIGMWFERFVLVVTSLAHNYDPAKWGSYTPSIVEIALTIGFFGWFALLFLVFIKLFPSVSVAETMEAEHAAARSEGDVHD
jgi:molybdopterin-containing oxidoreductase family membrane subunit